MLPGLLTTRSTSPGFAEDNYQNPKGTNDLPIINQFEPDQMRTVMGTPSILNNGMI